MLGGAQNAKPQAFGSFGSGFGVRGGPQQQQRQAKPQSCVGNSFGFGKPPPQHSWGSPAQQPFQWGQKTKEVAPKVVKFTLNLLNDWGRCKVANLFDSPSAQGKATRELRSGTSIHAARDPAFTGWLKVVSDSNHSVSLGFVREKDPGGGSWVEDKAQPVVAPTITAQQPFQWQQPQPKQQPAQQQPWSFKLQPQLTQQSLKLSTPAPAPGGWTCSPPVKFPTQPQPAQAGVQPIVASQQPAAPLFKMPQPTAPVFKLPQPAVVAPTEPKPTVPAHPGINCDLCTKPIFGARFKCLSCPNFDACEACVGQLPLTQKPAGQTGNCCHDITVRVKEPRWMAIGAEALQNQTGWCHPGFTCRGCGDGLAITGRRYTCTVCDNAHFCERCDFCGVHAVEGHPNHPMLRVASVAPQQQSAAVDVKHQQTQVQQAQQLKFGGVQIPLRNYDALCWCCGLPSDQADAMGHCKTKPKALLGC